MAGSFCGTYDYLVSLTLSAGAPFLSLLLIYFIPGLSKANFWKRTGVFVASSFTLLIGINVLVRQLCPLELEDIGISEKAGIAFNLLGFIFTFILSLVWLFATKWLGKEKLKLALRGFAVVIVLAVVIACGTYFANWMEPYKRSLRAAVSAEKIGDCEKAINLYKSQVSDHKEHAAEAYAHWARILIGCPDQKKRNPIEAKSLIEKAANAGPFDIEIADIAACVFAENKDFERALKISHDNKLEQRISLFSEQKTCFEK